MAKENEIKIGPDEIHLKGEAADIMLPPLKRLSKTSDSVLRLLDNVVGLPSDFISSKLEVFRQQYQENIDAIEKDKRVEPSFRIGCSVLKTVSYSVEEPELQKLFANLLSSASNEDLADSVHPSFATVINELTSDDARFLLNILEENQDSLNYSEKRVNVLNSPDKSLNISNLIRLGILEWTPAAYNHNELEKFVGKNNYYQVNENRLAQTTVDLVNDVQNLKNTLIKDRMNSHNREKLSLSRLGYDFLKTVIAPENTNNTS